MKKIDYDAVKENIELMDKDKVKKSLNALQVAVYTLCGGGLLSDFAARQPADFYIDDRVNIARKREIYQKVKIMVIMAETLGLDAHNLAWQYPYYL